MISQYRFYFLLLTYDRISFLKNGIFLLSLGWHMLLAWNRLRKINPKTPWNRMYATVYTFSTQHTVIWHTKHRYAQLRNINQTCVYKCVLIFSPITSPVTKWVFVRFKKILVIELQYYSTENVSRCVSYNIPIKNDSYRSI